MRPEIESLMFEAKTLHFESPARPRRFCLTCRDSLVARAGNGKYYCYDHFPLPAQMEIALS